MCENQRNSVLLSEVGDDFVDGLDCELLVGGEGEMIGSGGISGSAQQFPQIGYICRSLCDGGEFAQSCHQWGYRCCERAAPQVGYQHCRCVDTRRAQFVAR